MIAGDKMISEERSIRLKGFVAQVNKQLIVSCQALPDEALFGADIMAKIALAAAQGGTRALRANTPSGRESDQVTCRFTGNRFV
jgi:putative N-acetylmannosamine-6-phosphate epimerase